MRFKHSPPVQPCLEARESRHLLETGVDRLVLEESVLFNEQGEITECTRGNVAMLLHGRWLTPPLACGLLPGVGRALALREGRLTEAVVRVEDVSRVQAWAFLNSLRGWIGAEV